MCSDVSQLAEPRLVFVLYYSGFGKAHRTQASEA